MGLFKRKKYTISDASFIVNIDGDPNNQRFLIFLLLLKKKQVEKRMKLLKSAITVHNANTKASSFGNGIDRHLLMLKIMAIQRKAKTGKEIPNFFNQKIFSASSTFKLSTSNVSPALYHKGGFGMIHPGKLRFFVGNNNILHLLFYMYIYHIITDT